MWVGLAVLADSMLSAYGSATTGQRALDLRGELTLAGGPGGLSAGPFPVEITTLAVGDDRVIELPRETTVTVVFGPALVGSSAVVSPTTAVGMSVLVALLAFGTLGVVAYRRRDRTAPAGSQAAPLRCRRR